MKTPPLADVGVRARAARVRARRRRASASAPPLLCLFLLSPGAVAPVVLADAAPASLAAVAAPFASAERERRYYELLKELRCLVCQNQSLSDSDAALAGDLRAEVRRMIGNGDSDDEIVDFMTARYGDFVLFRPRFKAATWVLWLAPLVLLATGLFWLFRWQIVHRRRVEDARAARRRT